MRNLRKSNREGQTAPHNLPNMRQTSRFSGCSRGNDDKFVALSLNSTAAGRTEWSEILQVHPRRQPGQRQEYREATIFRRLEAYLRSCWHRRCAGSGEVARRQKETWAVRLDWDTVRTELQESAANMVIGGLQVEHYEVGPQTYELMQLAILAARNEDEADMLRTQIENGHTRLLFGGVPIVCCEVPEWRLWPPSETSVFATTRRLNADMETA